MDIYLNGKTEEERDLEEKELARQRRRALWDIDSLSDGYVEIPKDPDRWEKRIFRLKRFWAQLIANPNSPAFVLFLAMAFIAFMAATTAYTYFSILKVLMEGWPVLWLFVIGLMGGFDLILVAFFQNLCSARLLRHLVVTSLLTLALMSTQLILAFIIVM